MSREARVGNWPSRDLCRPASKVLLASLLLGTPGIRAPSKGVPQRREKRVNKNPALAW